MNRRWRRPRTSLPPRLVMRDGKCGQHPHNRDWESRRKMKHSAWKRRRRDIAWSDKTAEDVAYDEART